MPRPLPMPGGQDLGRTALVLVSVTALGLGLVATARTTRAQPAAESIVGRAEVRVGTCCGGAQRLDDEVCESVHAYDGPIEVRAGRRSVGPALARATAHHGRFQVALPPGTYCLVGGDKVGVPRGRGAPGVGTLHVDAACLAAHRTTCDAIVTVRPGATSHARVSMAAPCFGVCYRGPMPP